MVAAVSKLTLQVSAEDGVTPVLARIDRNIAKYAGPAVKPRFSDFESDVRKEMADRIRVMRDEAKKAGARDRSAEVRRAALEILGLPSLEETKVAARDVMSARNKVVEKAVDDGAGGVLGAIARTKKIFGARGPFKDVAELLVGGGAVAGLTFAFNGLANALDGVDEQLVKFRDTGQVAVHEIERSIVRAVPVVGRFIDSLAQVSATWLEIQIRAKEGIPLPQGPAGQVARQDTQITESQQGLARINLDTAFEQRTQNATEHQLAIANIEREHEAKLQAIEQAREAELQTIIAARGLDKQVGGRALAEQEFAARNLEFQQAQIEANAVAEQKRKDADRAEELRQNTLARTGAIAAAQSFFSHLGNEAKSIFGNVGQQSITDLFQKNPNAENDRRLQEEKDRRAAQFQPTTAGGFTGESRLLTGVLGQVGPQAQEVKKQTEIQKRIADAVVSFQADVKRLFGNLSAFSTPDLQPPSGI